MTEQHDATAGKISYVEFSATALEPTKAFYRDAFGWALTDFGPTYASTMTGDVDAGLQGDLPSGAKPPLPVIQVGNLEAALDRVIAAGADLVQPICSFPGGRRFHVRDPSGNEIAVMQID